MKFSHEEIISSTDMIKKYKECRDKTKILSRTVIFKNNQPDMVLLDIEEYKRIYKIIDELENIEIYNFIEERQRNDDGKRYSLDEAIKMLNIKSD